MATFDQHIAQAKRNLSFLSSVNQNNTPAWDWLVTIAFYTGVHLVNAHIAKRSDQHFRSHEQVDSAINPYNSLSPSKLVEDVYLAYTGLKNLSRRARYLCHESPNNKSSLEYLTFDTHFEKAIKKLDVLLKFMVDEHAISFSKPEVTSLNLKQEHLIHFRVVKLE